MLKTCPECYGDGELEVEYGITDWVNGHDVGCYTVTCPECYGDGTVECDDDEEEY